MSTITEKATRKYVLHLMEFVTSNILYDLKNVLHLCDRNSMLPSVMYAC